MYNLFLEVKMRMIYNVSVVYIDSMNSLLRTMKTSNYPKMDRNFRMEMSYLITRIYYTNKIRDNRNNSSIERDLIGRSEKIKINDRENHLTEKFTLYSFLKGS